MSETLLLVVLAIAITLVIFFLKRQVAARTAPLDKRVELGVRILLTFLGALIAHWQYGRSSGGLTFWLAVGASCLILYAVTHMADRIVLKG